jgi:DNA-binding NtrC family response regulator
VHCLSKPLLRVLPLDGNHATLGRLTGDDVPSDGLVSRQHAEVQYTRGRWTVTDCGSRNGCFVDGKQVEGAVTVGGSAVLRLGYTVFLLREDVRAFEAATVAVDEQAVTGPTFAAALARIARAAAGPCLLVQGETGTGKEHAARAFHRNGPQASGPFLAVNCAAIPEGVAERLLFGVLKGAYSGATANADGYLVAADGGTLFLDEIAELDPAVQAKLLRAIETGEVLPVGASQPRAITTRYCFASLRNLRAAVREGGFRGDLYYRIAKDEVVLPALRDRREEIPWLLAWALERSLLTAHAKLVESCLLRPWPGNVRELLSATERAASAARARGETVVRETDLDAEAGLDRDAAPAVALTAEVVEQTIATHAGNLAAAARALGMTRPALYRLLKRLNIDPRE